MRKGDRKKEFSALAIYQLSMKAIRRSQGGNAKAAAAYRSGTKIDQYDYTHRRGVADGFLVLPDAAPQWTRSQLWDEAEQAEKRCNSVVAREVLIALPHEMPADARRKAVERLAGFLVGRYGVALDAALHEPKKGHDERNHHAHILMTTRRLTAQGLGEKTRELDDKQTGPLEIEAIREQWAKILKGYGFNLEHRAAPVSETTCQTPPPAPSRNQVARSGNAPPPRLQARLKRSFPCSTGKRPIPPSRPAFTGRPNGEAVKGARSAGTEPRTATRNPVGVSMASMASTHPLTASSTGAPSQQEGRGKPPNLPRPIPSFSYRPKGRFQAPAPR